MSDILTERSGPILTITLNRPERGNAVSDEMVAELTRLVDGAQREAEIVVLRGSGKDFCVGRAQMGARPQKEPEALERRNFSDIVFDCYGALRNSRVPVVAVVQGMAAGFGCAVAAACDVTLASDAARFQVPEMAHNILPTMVMSSFIDRVPRKAAAYLVYSQAVIPPERAVAFGIVSEIFPAAKLEDGLKDLCAAMLKAPPVAIRGVKEYLRCAPDMAIQGAVDYARNLHATINSSSEIRKKPS